MGPLETNQHQGGRATSTTRSLRKQDAPKQFGAHDSARDELVQAPSAAFGKDGSFVFRQDAPLPVTITTLIPGGGNCGV